MLSAFPESDVAQGIDAAIARGLPRAGPRTSRRGIAAPSGSSASTAGRICLPTVIYCDDADHPLANQEYLFPFVSVVEVPADRLWSRSARAWL